MAQPLFGPDDSPLSNPEDVINFLGKGRAHWRGEYSACETAHSWFQADGLPATIQSILQTDPVLSGAMLKKAYFEKQTDLDNLGRPSQTDVIAIVATNSGQAVLGVEGKVEESFGPLVSDWNDYSPGKLRRLANLVERLGLKPSAAIGSLRYQLLHRTVATLLEAERFATTEAAMIVQSFSSKMSGFSAFEEFSSALGIPVTEAGRLSRPIKLGPTQIRLGWTTNGFCAPKTSALHDHG